MNDESTLDTDTLAGPTPARKRAPALVATVNGETYKLLKYAFPTKAIPFTVTVNGVEAQACSTAGRGAAYTYLLINNTGFYLPKNIMLFAGAEVALDFPADYAFDETQAVRVSTYKPKRAAATEGEVADDVAAETGNFEQAEVAEEEAAAAEAVSRRASRKGKSK